MLATPKKLLKNIKLYKPTHLITVNRITLLALLILPINSYAYYAGKNTNQDYLKSVVIKVLPEALQNKAVQVDNTINFINKTNKKFYNIRVPLYLKDNKNNKIYTKLIINKILINKKEIKYKLKVINKSSGLIVIGEKGKPLPENSKIEILYTMNYQHYKDTPPITKFHNTFTRQEGDLPVKHLRLEIKAPTQHKLDCVDYYNLVEGKTVSNFVVNKGIDNIIVDSKQELATNETTFVSASISSDISKTFFEQEVSNLFPTIPIDNDRNRISLSIAIIISLSWVIVKLLEIFIGNRVIREVILSLRFRIQELFINLDTLLGIRSNIKNKRYNYS